MGYEILGTVIYIPGNFSITRSNFLEIPLDPPFPKGEAYMCSDLSKSYSDARSTFDEGFIAGISIGPNIVINNRPTLTPKHYHGRAAKAKTAVLIATTHSPRLIAVLYGTDR